ncbi:hypothetical protein A3C28_02825 [Candidatus Roizmanbacteria bacterium RIFCSPHIGHO2_02_FULL_39_9]|uniref:Antitoxin n=1 Tax=Candidatus Roizmanbacteria bacterium RIFCSPHIGHO2_02_FULL_39_9 TaxID=1802040 RepID=A0A1F7H9R5_9BACT|nr:MAG: hypothetical protein A3C28_02825 [Candidatus Roizmanbacteria bacterium RIFCSPHIGHO2_02_FULL_39_9]
MNTVIYVKANREIKENAQRLAKELGLSLSDIINSSLRNFIRTREIYFSHTPRMTPELEELLDRVEDDLKKRRNLSPRFKTTKQAIDYLDNI